MGGRIAALLAQSDDDPSDGQEHSRIAQLLSEPDAPDFVSYRAPETAPAGHEPDLLERFLAPGQSAIDAHAGELRNAWDSAGDAASGLAGGLTGHLDQRLPFGIGDTIRADRETAHARSPMAEGGGELAGMVASPLGKVAKPAAFGLESGLLGHALSGAANAEIQGTARRVGDQADDNTDVLQAMLDSRGDAKLGGAIGGGAHIASEAASGASDLLGKGANYLRRIAYGVQPSDINEQMARRGTGAGLDYARNEMSQLPEQLGLSNTLKPRSVSSYAAGAEALRKEGGALKGSALDRADAVVPPEQIDFAKDDILSRLVGEHDADAAAFSSRGTEPAYQDLTRRLQDRPISKPSELDTMKQEYEQNSYAKGEGSMEAGQAAANKVAADEARNRLGGIMSGANRQSPGVLDDFVNGSQQFGDAATVEDIAKRAGAKSVVAPMLGGAVGGLAGYQTRHDFEGAGLGALGGAIATRGAQTYGADLGANIGRLGQRALGSTAEGLGAVAQAGGSLAAEHGSMQDSRGYDLPNVINKVLQDPQQAQRLGKYRAQFEDAGRTAGGIASLLNKLNRDREWRETYLPELQQMTGATQ